MLDNIMPFIENEADTYAFHPSLYIHVILLKNQHNNKINNADNGHNLHAL